MFLCIPPDTPLLPRHPPTLHSTPPPADTLLGRHHPLTEPPPPRHPSGDTTTCPRRTPPQADTPPGRHFPRHTAGHAPGPHNPTITAADSTHPTGMHSCLVSSSWNSSRLINHRCEWTFSTCPGRLLWIYDDMWHIYVGYQISP